MANVNPSDAISENSKKLKSFASQLLKELESIVPKDEDEERVAHREGPVARGIESQTAKIPSDAFLWGGLAAIGGAALLKIAGRDDTANFVGHWAPTILVLGLYNKLVKVAGSDRLDQGRKLAKGALH